MAERDGRRRVCDALARRLATPEGLRQARLLQLAGTFQPDAEAIPRAAGAAARRVLPAAPVPIGIWRPETVDGRLVFVRPDPPVLGDHWPPQRTLLPKHDPLPRRVCLLGESAAAGWFYAPHLTPARVLEEQLGEVDGPGGYEVVDLTRADLNALSLGDLIASSVQLKPDALVVFAGNNWPATLTDAGLPDFQAAGLALREAGPEGLVRRAQEASAQVVDALVERMAAVAREAGLPVIVVVPEVNLAGWERSRPVAWLPGGATAAWYAEGVTARRALAEGRPATAAAAAARMVELDRGTCAASARLLGDAQVALGRDQEAARALRGEVEARAWDNVPWLPGATTLVQERLRRGAEENGLSCVDLPALLARARGSPVTGESLFLDYCHFTPRGMKLAMAAVAAEVLRRLDPARHAQADGGALGERLSHPQVAAAVEGRARFMTGLYNGRWNVRSEGGPRAAEHWLAAALEVWPGAADAMMEYVATRAAPAEAMGFSEAQQRVYASADGLEHRVWSIVSLDPQGLEAICAVLERHGRPARETVARLLQEHHGIGAEGVDLLDTVYHWAFRDHHEARASFTHPRCLFYRAAWPRSEFCLVGDGEREVELEVTLRLPVVRRPREEEVTVALDGQAVGWLPAGAGWSRHRLRLGHLCPGLHRLGVHWPPPPPEGDAALEDAAARLEQGIPADVHPVFGELFRLRARAC